jgi:hypothetical protein
MPETYYVAYEDENGRTHSATVTVLDGPSLPIACQPPYKRLKIRNFRRSDVSLRDAVEDRPASDAVDHP